MGLADDGGLILPDHYPLVGNRMAEFTSLSFQDLAVETMSLFCNLPRETLARIVQDSYSTFSHPEITPLVPVGNFQVLELFHGPTLAFKDVALQFLGNLFDHCLVQRNQDLNIIVATSGDTGSAAIASVRGRSRMRIVVLHPKGRVSPLQERQMTSVLEPNVFNIAVDGSFDDCQRLVKELLQDVEFKRTRSLGAVNSINWARLLAQVVYYLRVCAQLSREKGKLPVTFAVPTGNFGDIFAGYVAWRMGAPIRRLILATNENDILARFFSTGDYSLGQVHQTIAPSMDIQIASNFERYLYHAVGDDPALLRELMRNFSHSGRILVEGGRDRDVFRAGAASRAETLATIAEVHKQHGYLLDPHTAVGVTVGRRLWDGVGSLVALATAHPAKFPDAVREATGVTPRHPILDALDGKATRVDQMPPDAAQLRRYIEERFPARSDGR